MIKIQTCLNCETRYTDKMIDTCPICRGKNVVKLERFIIHGSPDISGRGITKIEHVDEFGEAETIDIESMIEIIMEDMGSAFPDYSEFLSYYFAPVSNCGGLTMNLDYSDDDIPDDMSDKIENYFFYKFSILEGGQ